MGENGASGGEIQGGRVCLPTFFNHKTRRPLESHLEHVEAGSPGLVNTSSNELDDETESMLINFIGDTQLKLRGTLEYWLRIQMDPSRS